MFGVASGPAPPSKTPEASEGQVAATVVIEQLNGSGPTATTVVASPFLFGTSDVYNAGNTVPVQRPASGTNYSYEASFRMLASGTFTSLSNWKFYSDGANGLGTGLDITCKALAQGSYAQATGTSGVTATAMYGSPASLFTYSSGSPLSLTGSISSAGNGTVQLVRAQASVASTAAVGTSSSETSTAQWDES